MMRRELGYSVRKQKVAENGFSEIFNKVLRKKLFWSKGEPKKIFFLSIEKKFSKVAQNDGKMILNQVGGKKFLGQNFRFFPTPPSAVRTHFSDVFKHFVSLKLF